MLWDWWIYREIGSLWSKTLTLRERFATSLKEAKTSPSLLVSFGKRLGGFARALEPLYTSGLVQGRLITSGSPFSTWLVEELVKWPGPVLCWLCWRVGRKVLNWTCGLLGWSELHTWVRDTTHLWNRNTLVPNSPRPYSCWTFCRRE